MQHTNTTIQLPFTTSHAFLIGINNYQHLTPLSTAVNDARVLAQTLADDHGYQVHPPLLNATQAELMHLLEQELPRLVKENDRVFFYFAGHGIALDSDDNPKGYLVPADARPGDSKTLIAMDDFHQAITSLPCKHGMLILDCCFAGAFKWSTGFRDVIFDLPGIIYEERFYQYAQDAAWQVITSSASDQKAVDILADRTLGMRDDSTSEHSPFAAALLAGLAGEADTIPKDKGDGVITATELYTYLRDRVEDETTEQGKRQSPAMFSLQKHDKGQYIFLHPRHPLNLPPIPDRNPFMGLKSYNETDTSLFYGRDRVITALASLAQSQQLVVVSGASGTGKSSVIKAGLLPLLRKKEWTILPVIRPGKTPLNSLEAVTPQLTEHLTAKTPCLLIVDQYEELLTQCLQAEDREAFENQLAECLERYPSLRIIISIRADFEPQFEEGPLRKWWQSGRYNVPSFNQDELREVIIKPTVQEVLFYEPDTLVDKLIDAVNQAPGALPLLSFTLSELYHAYINSGRTNRAFTLEDYEKLGGVIGALRTRANSLYDGLDQAHQDSMRKLMLRMVSLEGGELASRRVASNDLIFSDAQETERLQNVAQQLVSARLISTGLDAQGQTYYEPAHDALIRAWARLWEWIKAQGEGKMSLLYKLSLAVADYQKNPTNEYLWHDDPRLELLLADLHSKGHGFNAQEEVFLEKSQALRRRNKRRRRGIVAAVMIGLASLALFALYEQQQAKEAQVLAQENEEKALDASALAAKEAENARMQADTALAARARAEQSDRLAQLRADTALMERNNALWQTTLARRAQNRAEQSAREAKSAATAAKAREMLDKNPTVALNLALAAYRLSPTKESSSSLHDIISDQKKAFYKHSLSAHDGEVTSVVISPVNNRILSAGTDSIVKVWNQSGRLLNTIKGYNGQIRCMAVSTDGELVAVGTDNGFVRLSTILGEELHLFSSQDEMVYSIAFSPDGEKVLTGSFNVQQANFAKLWSLSGDLVQSFTGHSTSILSVAFSPDGSKVLTGSSDRTAKIWDLSGQMLHAVSTGSGVFSVAFSANGEEFLTGLFGGQVKIWDVSGKETNTFGQNNNDDAINSIAFSPNDQLVLTGSRKGAVSLNNKNGSTIKVFQGHLSEVNTVSFSQDGKWIATGDKAGIVKLWNLNEFTLPIYLDAGSYTTSAAISADGQNKVTGGFSDSGNVWRKDGEKLAEFKFSNARFSAILKTVFSHDGKKILTGSSSGDIRMLDLSGTVLLEIATNPTQSIDLAFAPDGKSFLSTVGDSTATLWDLSGKALRKYSLTNARISSVGFSPDGTKIVTGGDNGVAVLWSLDGRQLQDFLGHTKMIKSVAFSPTGKTILTGSDDKTARLWNLTGQQLQKISGLEKNISTVAFSSTGDLIYTSSPEGGVIIWDLKSQKIQTIPYGALTVSVSSAQQLALISGPSGAKLVRNLYSEYLSGTLWDHVHKLTPAEQAEYKIDWDY